MPPSFRPSIGLQLMSTTKAVSRALDSALAAEGSSLPIWLIMISLKTRRLSNQRELAEAVGVRGATLTHHLNTMEHEGLLTRRRDPANRRVHLVELTEKGEATFIRLRKAAGAFDRRLRAGLNAEEIAAIEHVLAKLDDNVRRGRPT